MNCLRAGLWRDGGEWGSGSAGEPLREREGRGRETEGVAVEVHGDWGCRPVPRPTPLSYIRPPLIPVMPRTRMRGWVRTKANCHISILMPRVTSLCISGLASGTLPWV